MSKKRNLAKSIKIAGNSVIEIRPSFLTLIAKKNF